jgi:signal transduction histidine kinase/CheY-like chemotaxis protein
MKSNQEKKSNAPILDALFSEKLLSLLDSAGVSAVEKSQLIALSSLGSARHFSFFVIQNDDVVFFNTYAKDFLNDLYGISDESRVNECKIQRQKVFQNDLQEARNSTNLIIKEYDITNSRIQVCLERLESDAAEFILGLLVDITTRHKVEEKERLLQEQIFRTQKMESLNTLARGIAHDFNNILTSILGNIALFKTEFTENENEAELVLNIEKSARRGVHLVSEMLSYSQTSSTNKNVFNLNSLISDTIGICRTSISKKIMLHHQLVPELPPIEADLSQIQQAIMAISLHAADTIGDANGILTITTGTFEVDENYCREFHGFLIPHPGAYVFFEIHDTGPGLEAGSVQRMFEPYFPVGSGGRRSLKLPTAFNIIQHNDGFIQVQSYRQLGTSIVVYLPITDKKISPEESKLLNVLENVHTILLVDDEEIVQITIQKILKRLGYSVFTADNGAQAVQLFQKMKDEIDLILLDLTMPVMGGEDALVEIRKIDPDAKVILFSGYDEVEVSQRLHSASVLGFVEKPSLIDELGRRIQKLFEKKDDSID